MSSENQTNIRFSLKETVWFQKGQEVKEVRSLSLNPDITIQQFEEYVQVKGVLTLEGNYTPDLANQGDYYSLRELAPSRMIENVIALEDGSCELSHQFPVDISIPLTRITDLENLCVSVETFDYQLAEKGSIQIAADLCISGLHDHNRAVETYQEQRGYEQYNNYSYENEYRSSNEVNEGYEYQPEREQEEHFQFFHQPTSEQETSEQNNLYGSDWIQSLEENEEQEEQDTYPGQPTYLEVFQPEEVVEDRVEEVENEVEHYYELEESNEQSFEEEQQVEEQFNVEIMAQSEQFEQLEEQSEAQEEEEYEEVFRGFNISAEAMEPQVMEPQVMEPQAMEPQTVEPEAVDTTPSFLMNNNDAEASQSVNDAQVANSVNNPYNERPSFLNNDFNVHSYLNNSLNSRPSFLDNDFSTLQNASNESNAQKEIEKYEELYNRTLEQNYQPYVNQQFQQAPFAYNQNQQAPFANNQNQQQYYQNPFPQVNQENSFAHPNDVRQTPPYYADYYQAQVEQQEVPPELPKVEIKAEPVVNKEVKEEVSEARSVKSDNLLSSLFTGEGREDSYTKLKLYLAQNGDTIESVAKKYNLQTQQLNRVNNLNDEFLSEGQIIYIPVTAIKQ